MEVEWPKRRRMRRNGKSGTVDSELAARARKRPTRRLTCPRVRAVAHVPSSTSQTRKALRRPKRTANTTSSATSTTTTAMTPKDTRYLPTADANYLCSRTSNTL